MSDFSDFCSFRFRCRDSLSTVEQSLEFLPADLLLLKEKRGGGVQYIPVGENDLARFLVALVDDALFFLIDKLCKVLTVGAGLSVITPDKDFVIAAAAITAAAAA